MSARVCRSARTKRFPFGKAHPLSASLNIHGNPRSSRVTERARRREDARLHPASHLRVVISVVGRACHRRDLRGGSLLEISFSVFRSFRLALYPYLSLRSPGGEKENTRWETVIFHRDFYLLAMGEVREYSVFGSVVLPAGDRHRETRD